jgi:ABC-type Fe3+-siderophore transport system permease subunit
MNYASQRKRRTLFWFIPGCVAALLCLYNILRYAPASGWPSLPFDPARMTIDQIIIVYGLLPRAAVALLCGAALGLSGALLQRLLRNPIADPSTLGISAGAQLAIVLATLYAPDLIENGRGLVALAGAGGAAALVILLGWRRDLDPVVMILGGLLISITASALSAALVLSQGEYLMSLVAWNGGALSQQDWLTTQTLLMQLTLGIVATALLARPLVILGLNDGSARSLGLSVGTLRLAVIALSVWLAASVSAAVGLVSFIGLAAPSLVRLAGIRRTTSVLMASPIAGALLLWLADGLVQLLSSSTGETFPTGAITALLGGPLLLWLLPRLRLRQAATQGSGQTSHRLKRPVVWLAVLFAIIPLLALLILSLGRVPDGWVFAHGEVFEDLLPWRGPRLLAAASAGSLLAIAGTVMQRITGNPMAGPEVMGISGGAGVGFAAALYVFETPGPAELFGCAAVGAIVVLVAVTTYILKRNAPVDRLLLAGIGISSFTSAILSLLIATGDPRSWQILVWISGSSLSVTFSQSLALAGLAVTVLIVSVFCQRWLEILPLGEAMPLSLGLSERGSRVVLISVAAISTAAASMLVGPLSFVGLMAPHMARLAGFRRAGMHLPAACLIGALLMLVADWGSRTVTFPYEQPLGLFASLVGAPYLIWLIGRQR